MFVLMIRSALKNGLFYRCFFKVDSQSTIEGSIVNITEKLKIKVSKCELWNHSSELFKPHDIKIHWSPRHFAHASLTKA